MMETQEPENKDKNPDDIVDDSSPKEENVEEKEPEREPKDVTITDIELEHLRNEVKQNQDKYLRELAESKNLLRRMQKEKQELMQHSVRSLVSEFLNPIDQMEKALTFASEGSDEVKNWAIGFEMILKQFKDVLVINGVKSYESLNKPFDPHYHEAVESIETDEHPEGTVIEELLKGYQMGERVVRHARVKVAKKPQDKSEKTEAVENLDEDNNKENQDV